MLEIKDYWLEIKLIATFPAGKADSLDKILPEFLKNSVAQVKQWLLVVFNTIIASN